MVFENENSNEWGQYIFLSDEENNVENKYLKSRQNYNTNSQKTYNIEYLNDADYYYSYDSLLSYESLVNKENITNGKNKNDFMERRHPVLFFITCIIDFYNYFLK